MNKSKIERFEDIVAWQKARELARAVYGCSKVGQFAKDYGLKDQVQRAAVSAMGNIAEGYDRGGDKEFVQFLSTSKSSLERAFESTGCGLWTLDFGLFL